MHVGGGCNDLALKAVASSLIRKVEVVDKRRNPYDSTVCNVYLQKRRGILTPAEL